MVICSVHYLQSKCLVSGTYPCFTAHVSLLLHKDGVCGRQVQGAHPAPPPGGHSVEQPDFLHLKEQEEDKHGTAPSTAAAITGVHVISALINTPCSINTAPLTLAGDVAGAIHAR